jgi:hypothetical protein
VLPFRSLDPFRALREPDPRRRDEKRPFPLRTKNCQHNPNNRLTGKAPYKFESISLHRRVSCEPRSSRSAQAASVAIDESVRRDPQRDVGHPRARTAAVSRCHRCTICCDSGRPANQCGNDTDVAGSRGDLGMRRSCPTKQSRRHRSAGTPRVSPSFFFRVPEKTAGHQRVAFPIDS